ncbi:MAG: nitroreductase family protein [Deltaproteobacteria bacterium]|nr:nitroreductase family protein [Deltaproteobacteria bacterium]
MIFIEVNQQTCNQDGICSAVCPAKLINFIEGEYPVPIAEAEELCIRCGHCVAVCPTSSLLHAGMPLADCPKVQPELLLSTEQCEQFLRSRRSIRNYRDKTVHQETLQKLIEMARYAPTGHNTQSVEWLVLSDRDELNNLAQIVGQWMRWMLANMKEFALSFHMDKALERLEEGEDVVLRGAPVVLVAHAPKEDHMAQSSCTIALTYLELCATGMGLGGCWAGYFNAAVNTFPPMQQALGLPEGHQCYGAMMIGYPKFRYHRMPERKAPSITWR